MRPSVRSGNIRSMAQSRSRLDIATILRLARDILRFVSSTFRPHAQPAAENLFLRKQLALYIERQVKPRRTDDATRMTLVALSRLIDWRRPARVVAHEVSTSTARTTGTPFDAIGSASP